MDYRYRGILSYHCTLSCLDNVRSIVACSVELPNGGSAFAIKQRDAYLTDYLVFRDFLSVLDF